jgi:hypothetical protein
MRIGFTDQRLTAHGGLAVWTRFITERGLRAQLRAVLPHAPTSPNAYDPCDTALGFIGASSAEPTSWRGPPTWRTTRRWPRCSASRRCRVSPRSRVSSHAAVAARARRFLACTAGRWKNCRCERRARPGSRCRTSCTTTFDWSSCASASAKRPHDGGKQLLEVPGYKFQVLRPNLPSSVSALEVNLPLKSLNSGKLFPEITASCCFRRNHLRCGGLRRGRRLVSIYSVLLRVPRFVRAYWLSCRN